MTTVHAKHPPYDDGHLGEVVEAMRLFGPPTIRVMRFKDGLYATEGSHRLAAAAYLGLIPKIVIEIAEPTALPDAHWTKVAAALPRHEYDHVLALDLADFAATPK